MNKYIVKDSCGGEVTVGADNIVFTSENAGQNLVVLRVLDMRTGDNVPVAVFNNPISVLKQDNIFKK